MLDIFKTKSDLLKEIDKLKSGLETKKNLALRFNARFKDRKTIPTKIAKQFLNNLIK